MPRGVALTLRFCARALALLAAAYTIILVLLAFQGFAPALCTHVVCRQIRLPSESFGLLVFFGFNCAFAAATWFSAFLLAKFVSGGNPALISDHLLRTVRLGSLTTIALSCVFLLLPMAFTIFVAVVYAVGAFVGLVWLVFR